MATGRPPDAICRIVKDGILELETEAGRKPFYNGVLMFDGMLIVVDWNEYNLEIHNGHNGKLITSHRLEYNPTDVCLINKNEVAVSLQYGTVVILSLKSINDVKLVKTLETGFDVCDSLAKWNSDKLVISGRKDDMLCWGILSITDGRMDSTHDICEGVRTRMAVKDNTLYISCLTDDSINIGVHVCDLSNSQTLKFLYQHQELETPWSIMADRDYVYVCDYNSKRIHQLTDSGQLVTIHRVSSDPLAIFYDDQHGLLYTTSLESSVITFYKMESLHQPGTAIPDKTKNKVDREDQKEKRQLFFGETKASEQDIVSQKGNTSRVKQEAKISPLRPVNNVDPVEQVTRRLRKTGPAIPAKAVIKVDRKEKRQLFFGETKASEQDIVSQKGNTSRVKQEAKISPLRPVNNVDPVEQVTRRLRKTGPAIPAKAVIKVDRKEKSQPVLGETRASEQAKVSQKQETKISPFRPMISVDPVEQLTQTLSEAGIHESILMRLSKDLICNDWKFFFQELSVTEEEIKQIEFDHRHYSVREQIYQLLFFSNKKGILNKRSIIDALQSIGRVDLVTKYKRETFPDS